MGNAPSDSATTERRTSRAASSARKHDAARGQRHRSAKKPIDECANCARSVAGPCLRCRRRAQRLFDAVEAGSSPTAAAAYENVTIAMARELIAEERDRRAMAAVSVPPVPNDQLRREFGRLCRLHENYPTTLARAGGWASPTDPLRLLGVVDTSDRTIRGVVYPGTTTTHVTTAASGRLAIAMGLAPNDFD